MEEEEIHHLCHILPQSQIQQTSPRKKLTEYDFTNVESQLSSIHLFSSLWAHPGGANMYVLHK